MSRAAQKLISASGGKAYEIEQSLMLDEGDEAKLRRTPSSEGNRKTFTFSTWCKRASLGYGGTAGSDYNYLMGAFISAGGSTDDSHYFAFGFMNSDALVAGGWSTTFRLTNRLFRDTSAWYHLVLQVDTTQGTADNRVKLYVNGVQETSFSTSNNPSQNYDLAVNNTVPQAISDTAYDSGTGPYHFDGYMAETHLFDGAVVAPSEFGETDSVTGQWIPKEYKGTASYGTNGYYMKYVSGAIGTDSSGQGNNYTTTNLANGDVVLDTPTNNFPTVNFLEPWNTTVSDVRQGNLNIKAATYSSGNYGNHHINFKLPTSGKWYFEWLSGIQAGTGNQAQVGVNKQGYVGINIPNQSQNPASFGGSTAMTMEISGDQAEIYDGGSAIDTDTGLTASSYVCAIAIDIDNNKFWGGYDNGSSITWMNSGDPAAGSNGAAHTFNNESLIYATTTVNSLNSNRSYIILNFGQNGTFSNYKTAGGNTDSAGIGNFFYSPPSGFKALCTKNLSTPAVKKSSEHFDTILYTGDASAKTISGLEFQPDFLWIKNRTSNYHHANVDSVRGATKLISTSQGIGELTTTEQVKTFTSDGFTLGDNSDGNNYVNLNTHNYAAWCWKAGGGTTTDVSESGSGTSRINASSRTVNTDAGFSIIKYTGSNDEISNGQHTKLNHGLSQAPDLIIVKNLDEDEAWTLTSSASQMGFNDYTLFPSSSTGLYGSEYMGTTDPDSTYIYLGNSDYINDDGNNYIAYAWHEVDGFSKFGTYEANNSTNGVFVYTGFSVSWVIFKYIDANGEWWWMLDSTRDPYGNLVTEVLYTNSNSAESGISSSGGVDFLSNGFKIRATNGGINTANTYFYMAFAESPFKYANAR